LLIEHNETSRLSRSFALPKGDHSDSHFTGGSRWSTPATPRRPFGTGLGLCKSTACPKAAKQWHTKTGAGSSRVCLKAQVFALVRREADLFFAAFAAVVP
jgi:hypothetical protein